MIEQVRADRPRCEAERSIERLELMLREADHRIANSLQAAIAMTHKTADRPGAAMDCAIGPLAARLAAIARVHQLLSRTRAAGMIEIRPYLEELVGGLISLWTGHRGVASISLVCDAGRVGGEAAIRLGMIVHELVANSAKYAYRDAPAGEVRILFLIGGGTYTLLVADDGCGQDRAPSTAGTGLGKKLVVGLAAMLGGRFRYAAAPAGTIALLTGPAEALLARDAISWASPDGVDNDKRRERHMGSAPAVLSGDDRPRV